MRENKIESRHDHGGVSSKIDDFRVKAGREKRWLGDNREAVASINSFIDRHGLLASRLRYRPGT